MRKLYYPPYLPRFISLSRHDAGAARPKPDYDPSAVQRSKFLNGIQVVAAKRCAPMAACTIMFQAGSRFEDPDSRGATHFVRACSDATGHAYTAYAKMRYLQQQGGYITCTSDRQTISFTLRCPPTLFPDLKCYLLDTAARCCFNPWEVKDRRSLVKDDLSRITPEQRVLDLIQKASFTGPLANSVFCERDLIDEIDSTTLRCFTYKNFRTDVCNVASVGIPLEETMKLAQKIECKTHAPEAPRVVAPSCPRAGYEYHDLGPGSETWIALAVPASGTSDFCNLLKENVVAAACGSGCLQHGQHEYDRIMQPPLGLISGNDVHTSYRAFNIAYEDVGLFGILAKTQACSAYDVALSAAEFLRNVGELHFKQIGVGKERLKLALSLNAEDPILSSEDYALQLASGHQIDNAKAALAIVDSVFPDEVYTTAKELGAKCSTQMSMAVVGDVGVTPHDRELGV